MHEILERFIGRYPVWRDRRLQHNPLDAPALIAVIGIVQIAYNLLARRNFSWRAAFLTVINVAFLVTLRSEVALGVAYFAHLGCDDSPPGTFGI